MTDYLKIHENFKVIKEVKDYIDDVSLLRYCYRSQQFTNMLEHIRILTTKYIAETIIWNAANPSAPQSIEQAYINAENLMQIQCAKIITKTVKNYDQRLYAAYVESTAK